MNILNAAGPLTQCETKKQRRDTLWYKSNTKSVLKHNNVRRHKYAMHNEDKWNESYSMSIMQ